MNNKGQTLVLFLFILPILLVMFITLYQLGHLQLEKKELEKSMEEVIRYGVDYWGTETIEEDMIVMFQKSFPNISRENIAIEVEQDKVKMSVWKEYNLSFWRKETIHLSYEGEKIDGKVQIVKE